MSTFPDQLTLDQQGKAKRVIRPHLDLLLRTALSLTRHQQAAEDLVQDAVLKAVRAIDSFREGSEPQAWLMTILRRAHIDTLRRGKSRPSAVSLNAEKAPEPAADPEPEREDDWGGEPEAILQRFGDEGLIAALRTLPEEIRWTLLLVDVEQMPHTQAAEVLDIAEGTVKSRAHRGRRMLRRQLAQAAKRNGWIKRRSQQVPS